MVFNAYVKSGTNTTCVDKECVWKLRMHSQGHRSEGHTEPQTQHIQNAEPACTQINMTRLTHISAEIILRQRMPPESTFKSCE